MYTKCVLRVPRSRDVSARRPCAACGPARVARPAWPGRGGPARVARPGWPGRGGPAGVSRPAWPSRRVPAGVAEPACPGRRGRAGVSRPAWPSRRVPANVARPTWPSPRGCEDWSHPSDLSPHPRESGWSRHGQVPGGPVRREACRRERRLGALVPWCLGALVPWCLGALVRWRVGAWCLGALVPGWFGPGSGSQSYWGRSGPSAAQSSTGAARSRMAASRPSRASR
jgi:hypothetical protein